MNTKSFNNRSSILGFAARSFTFSLCSYSIISCSNTDDPEEHSGAFSESGGSLPDCEPGTNMCDCRHGFLCDDGLHCDQGVCVSDPWSETGDPEDDPRECFIESDCSEQIDGMICIPAGVFEMGQENTMYSIHRTLCMSDFYISRTEITQAEYKHCVDAGECKVPSSQAETWPTEGYEDHPVVNVTWQDADTYCRWVGMRLPTEAEWEKAARGTDGRTFPWGEQGPSCELVVMREDYGTEPGCGTGSTKPVGSKSPSGDSPYDVADMAGNVAEWVADWKFEGIESTDDNVWIYGRDPQGPPDGTEKVFRGGSFDDSGIEAFYTYRGFSREPQAAAYALGFRCATSVQ